MSGGMESWKELGVSPVLLQALQEEGFTEPTPIQALVLPHAIRHRLDIIGAAQTVSSVCDRLDITWTSQTILHFSAALHLCPFYKSQCQY